MVLYVISHNPASTTISIHPEVHMRGIVKNVRNNRGNKQSMIEAKVEMHITTINTHPNAVVTEAILQLTPSVPWYNGK